jgi:hypothetical protein
VPGANVLTASTQIFPASVSDTTGSSSVTWENGAVTLQSVTNGTGTAGYNYSSLAPKNFAGIIGDRDFDLQYDFSLPNGTITASQYFSYVRLDMYLPATNGKQNNMFVARMKNGFQFSATVNGVNETGTFTTTATSGTLRMVRSNRQLSGYYREGANWTLLYQHSQPLTADLAPTWAGFAQHANRAEPQDITAVVDNFRFNAIGGVLQYNDSGLTAGTDYCYRVYPLKTDSCPNWENQAAQFSYTTPSNSLPDQPVNLDPTDGTIDVHTLHPTLTASTFNDPDGDTHYASQWRISTGSGADFAANIVYNSGVVSPSISHSVTTALATDTPYYWQAGYQDSKGEWSPWSSETSFTITNLPPNQPVNSTPAAGATGILPPHPNLAASAFADDDTSDTQQASQWLVSSGSGAAFVAGIVYDSGVAAASNTHTVTGNLAALTTYFWKVRYQDNLGAWSLYSNESSFTTGTFYTLFTNMRAITLSPATPASDYQVKINLTPVSFNYTKLKADGSDIKFYDSGDQELSYWIETWNPAGNSAIWVKVPSSGTTTIYMAYGNASLSSSSIGPATFDMYFENVADGGSSAPDLQNSAGFIIETSLTVNTLATEGPQISLNRTGNGSEQTNIDYLKGANLLRRFDYSATGAVSNSQNISYLPYPLNEAKKWKIVVKQDTGNSYWFYVDDTLKLSGTNLPYTHGGVWFGGWSTGDSGIFHYLFVRKYAASEPVAVVGAEI